MQGLLLQDVLTFKESQEIRGDQILQTPATLDPLLYFQPTPLPPDSSSEQECWDLRFLGKRIPQRYVAFGGGRGLWRICFGDDIPCLKLT